MSTDTSAKKVNLFAKARNKTAAEPTKTKTKETVWRLGQEKLDDPSSAQLEEAVHMVVELSGKLKTLETQNDIYKKRVVNFANGRFCDHLATVGVEPPTPLKVVNSQGESLTFVVVDRGHLAKVSDQQFDGLSELLGEDAAKTLVYDCGEFTFNPMVMSQDGVSDVVGEAISETINKLVADGKLTSGQAESLLEYKSERHFKPGLVARATDVCGRNRDRIERFLDLMAGGCSRYVRC